MNLTYFTQMNLYHALRQFFAELNIPLYALTELPTTAAEMLTTTFNPKNPAHQLIDDVYLVGGVDEAVFQQQAAALTVPQLRARQYEGVLIFGVTLTARPTRTQMAEITRAFNREFHYTPVVVALQYQKDGGGMLLSFANCERLPYQQAWREGEKTGKVSILKDVDPAQPHTGHLRILDGLKIERTGKQAITSFVALYEAWREVFSVALLNKRFYQELANWYFWAMTQVEFPDDDEKDAHIRHAKSLIRLLTRIIFIWFIKEKSLVPETLFDANEMPGLLKTFLQDDRSSSYYQAILQNLFFATLNKPMGERAFADERGWPYNRKEYGVKTLFRYADQFRISQDEVLARFAGIPFLNGGLFDCLDKDDKDDDRKVSAYVDGFSRNPKKRAIVPDRLFFMPQEREIDLTAAYDPTAKKPLLRKVRGLFDILNSYKFTVAENTPIEEEIALDPELLGKVFENLLASYNPETQTTARKQTGSFYTPREIVNYMVDESLIAYLTQATQQTQAPQTLASLAPAAPLALETRLRHLLSYTDEPPRFSDEERRALIAAINRGKILDPACGSGAFPMGALHKLVHLLHRLDPDNRLWKAEQRERLIGEKIAELKRDKAVAAQLSDEKVREQAMQAIDDRLRDIEAVFDREFQGDDYARKLFLIENGIYGVDIQPVAVQIAKLRCFISLIIDQKPNPTAPNLGLRALPNLETKFVAANTLIGLEKPEGHQLALKTEEMARLEKALKALRHDYFTAKTRHDKLNAQENDAALRQQIARQLVNDGWNNETARQLVAFDPYNQNAFADFFDAEWMFGMPDGFDIVIGNPPYGAKFNTEEKRLFSKIFKHQDYQLDSYLLFLEHAFNLVKHRGIISFIIPNPWLTNLKLKKIRRFLANEQTVLNITHYHKTVFDATVDTEVVFFRKQLEEHNQVKIVVHDKANQNSTKYISQEIWRKLNGEPINIFIDEHTERIIFILEQNSSPLGYICNVVSGLVPYEVGKGNPPQTRQMLDNRVYDATYKIDETYRATLRGKDIEKYLIKWDGTRWMKYGDNLAAPRYTANFDATEKIVIRQTGDSLIATLDTKQFVCLKNMHVITAKNPEFALKYILALLNSRLLDFFYQTLNPEKGEALAEVKKENVEKLLIKQIPLTEQHPFEALVDQILAAKQRDPAADTRALEAEIDRRVYALYELTPEEIAIVEGQSR